MRRSGWTLIALAALLFLGLFLFYPALKLTAGSFGAGEYFAEFFGKPYYLRALWNSVWLSAAATAGCIVIGVPLAVLVARYDIIGKDLIRAAATISLLSPPFIGAYAWIVLLGRSGIITRALALEGFSIYGAKGILLIFILHHFAYVFLLTTAALGRIDSALEEAAETMGASPWRRLLTVTLPLVLPAILAGALLVFTTTLADFGTPMLVGEGLRTLPVLAYGEFLNELGGNAGMASAVSVIMLTVALLALGVQSWALGGRNYAMTGLRTPHVRPLNGLWRWVASAIAILLAGVAALPQAVVVITSFLRARGPIITGEWGLDNYERVFRTMTRPLTNTLTFATVATLLMLLAGLLIGYLLVRRPGIATRAVDALLVLAQVLPGTVLGIGLLITWGRPPFSLTGTGAILVIAYTVRRMAYTVRSAAAGLRQIHPAMEEASLTLGASPMRTFIRVTAPLMLPAALAGALVSWVSTLSELSSTIMLYTGRTTTVSVQIYTQVLSDSFGTAAALGTLLIFLTLGALWLLRRWADRSQGLGI